MLGQSFSTDVALFAPQYVGVSVMMFFAATLALLALLALVAPTFHLVDQPDGLRKTHSRPTPLIGGLAIIGAGVLGIVLSTGFSTTGAYAFAILGAISLFYAVDDAADLPPKLRFAADGAFAGALIFVTGDQLDSFGVFFGRDLTFVAFAVPVTIFVYVALTNAYNMIDGLDGLFLSQFLISVTAIAAWAEIHEVGSGMANPMSLITLASLVVLLANFGLLGSGLKCFLGDNGSKALGFGLVAYAVSIGSETLPPAVAAFFFAIPMLDMCVVGAKRIRRGESPMNGDRSHIHHCLVDAGFSRRQAVIVIALASAIIASIAFVLDYYDAPHELFFAVFMAITLPYWLARDEIVGLLSGRLPRAYT